MNDSKRLLSSMLGDRGYEILEKAIYKQRTQAVIDPLEYYLPLIVVPRTILSWLIQTIKPMKPGEIKDVKFPGRDDISIHFEKQDVDQYRAEFVSGGKVIHTFEKQSLPAASAHLMTVGELYDDFDDKDKSDDDLVQEEIDKSPELDAPKAEGPSYDTLRTMIDMANVKPASDPEQVKWEMSHANVRELTAVIGKLVDSLTAKHMASSRLESELDKVSEKEVSGDPQKRENTQTPEEKMKADLAAEKKNPVIEEKQQSIVQVRDQKAEPAQDQPTPDPKKVESGEEAAEGKIQKDALHEASMTAAKNISSPRMAGAQNDQDQQKGILQRMKPDYFKKKHEILMKPYRSEAQRRWAHTAEGKKALGGNAAVHEWDESTKGKHLPEKVGKDEKQVTSGSSPTGTGGMTNAKKPGGNAMAFPVLASEKKMDKAEMPKGAGQPNAPKAPQPPKPPVPASNAPAASATKQAEQSGKGNIKAPGVKPPKNPSMVKCDYFRSKLGKTETVTEEEIYKTACPDCGKPEFVKGEDGNPSFQPCACFRVLKKDEEGHPTKFVQALKKGDGTFSLQFDNDADPEAIKIFLLTLKSRLLLNKRFKV